MKKFTYTKHKKKNILTYSNKFLIRNTSFKFQSLTKPKYLSGILHKHQQMQLNETFFVYFTVFVSYAVQNFKRKFL